MTFKFWCVNNCCITRFIFVLFLFNFKTIHILYLMSKIMKDDDNKKFYALILGASSGFGEAIALKLAEDGFNIIGVHLDRQVTMPHVEEIKSKIKAFGVDHIFANELIIRDNKVSGEFLWPLGAGKEKKADIIRNLCNDLNISPNETIYIGDSDKDIEAFKEVGLSIAFNSNCKELKDIATFVVDSDNLSKVLKYLPK